jgi:predicted amidohydrolase YtcJ
MHSIGKLKLRVTKSLPLESLSQAIALGLRSGFGDDVLRIGNIKMFTDGALGVHTAAMFEPYENEPDNRGMLIMDSADIFEHGSEAVENGLALAIHAIGDRANHEALNALEKLRLLEPQQLPGTQLRHRIEHVQILDPGDNSRLASLGVVASMQPVHAISDMQMADLNWGKRAAHAYAWKTQLSQGAVVAFGSDAPVEEPNPFLGLHAAVTRQRVDGSPGKEGWYPGQRLSRLEALQGFTTGPAYAANMEDRLGKLAPNYLADLLVLEKDFFTCHVQEIQHIKPIATMIGGKWVYGNLG